MLAALPASHSAFGWGRDQVSRAGACGPGPGQRALTNTQARVTRRRLAPVAAIR